MPLGRSGYPPHHHHLPEGLRSFLNTIIRSLAHPLTHAQRERKSVWVLMWVWMWVCMHIFSTRPVCCQIAMSPVLAEARLRFASGLAAKSAQKGCYVHVTVMHCKRACKFPPPRPHVYVDCSVRASESHMVLTTFSRLIPVTGSFVPLHSD